MASRNIKWSKTVQTRIKEIFDWYAREVDHLAAEHFIQDVLSTANIVSQMPTIGTKDTRRSTEGKMYYSILIHPKYRLIYRFTSRTIYIVAIHCTLMKG